MLSDAPILGVDAPFSSSNTPRLPYVDNTTFLVGGLDPAIDDNIHLVPTLKEPEKPVSSRAGLFALQDDNDEVAFPPARESFTTLPMGMLFPVLRCRYSKEKWFSVKSYTLVLKYVYV